MKKELIVPDSSVNQPQQQPARDYSNIRASMFPGFNIPMEVVKENTFHGVLQGYRDKFEYENCLSRRMFNNGVSYHPESAPSAIDLGSGSIQSYTSEIKVVKYGTQLYNLDDTPSQSYQKLMYELLDREVVAINRQVANMIAYGNGLDYEIAYTQGDTYPRIISVSLPARHHPPIESLSEPLNDTDSDDDTDTNPT